MKLTKDTIAEIQLPPGKTEVIVYDSEIAGFGLRIREGGSRTLVFSYKIGNKHRRLTLGTATTHSFGTVKRNGEAIKLCVRERVLQLQAQVRLGNDPAAAKETKRREADQTFGKIVGQQYIAGLEDRLAPRTVDETTRYLKVLAKPLHGLTLAGITRRDIADVLTLTATNNGPVAANRLRAALSAMFSWAMQQGLADANPVIGTEKREETPRDRVLTDVELAEIWNALPGNAFGDIVKLLMLTGQRRSEIGGLRWSEVDVNKGLITLPRTRTKNGVEHIVPMSGPVVDIVSKWPVIVDRNIIFGRGKNGVSGWFEGKEALDQHIQETRRKALGEKAAPMPEWTLHDIRRSVATGMAKLGVPPHVIEAVLNHVSGHKAGVAGIYNRNTYEPEKRQALMLWAEHLMSVVYGKTAKIVPIKVA